MLHLEDSFRAIVVTASDPDPIPVNFISFSSYQSTLLEYFFDCASMGNQLSSISRTELTDKCKQYEAWQNGYTQFSRISDLQGIQANGLIQFGLVINGERDANILLSNKNIVDWSNNGAYEIGENGSTDGVVRRFIWNDHSFSQLLVALKIAGSSFETVLRLTCIWLMFAMMDFYRKSCQSFWLFNCQLVSGVLWVCGKTVCSNDCLIPGGNIRLFAKQELTKKYTLLLAGTLPNPMQINFVSFATAEGARVEFFYECPLNIKKSDLQLFNYPIDERSLYTKTQIRSDCINFQVFDEEFQQFHKISDFEGLQPEGYSIRLSFFVQAGQNVNLLLTSSQRPVWDMEKVYQIGNARWNSSRRFEKLSNDSLFSHWRKQHSITHSIQKQQRRRWCDFFSFREWDSFNGENCEIHRSNNNGYVVGVSLTTIEIINLHFRWANWSVYSRINREIASTHRGIWSESDSNSVFPLHDHRQYQRWILLQLSVQIDRQHLPPMRRACSIVATANPSENKCVNFRILLTFEYSKLFN